MSVNEETYHLINSYLAGELQGRKLDKFKADLKSDPELLESLNNQKNIIAALETHRELELKKVITEGTKRKSIFAISPKIRIALATAAAVALIALVFIKLPRFVPSQKDSPTAEESDLQDATENIVIESKPEIQDSSNQSETEIDTQTLAVVTPPVAEMEVVVVEDEITDLLGAVEMEEDMDSEVAEEEPAMEEVETPIPAKPESTSNVASKERSTTNGKEDMDVLKDELLTTKSYPVALISPDFPPAVTVNTEYDMADDLKMNADAEAPKEVEKKKVINSRSVSVEHWKSVVNYKGYKYDGSTVQLYGTSPSENISFKELDNRLYINLEGKNYYVEKNKDHKRLVEVTNPTLLKVLNE